MFVDPAALFGSCALCLLPFNLVLKFHCVGFTAIHWRT